MEYEYQFTVFTPTYNRVHTLHRVYESLAAQTFRDFEWLIVDDGSTDDTSHVVSHWIEEAGFPIRYLWQRNSGKHAAFNRAVSEAKGRFFVPADSDDRFVPTALERFLFHWNTIPQSRRHEFTGVACLCMTEQGDVIGTQFPFNPTDSDSLEISYKYKVRGEKWGFHRTDVLRQFPFPEVPGVKFVPESILWNRIARRYKIRFVNEALRIYTQDAGDQLTKRSAKERASVRVFYAVPLNTELDFLKHDPLSFLKISIQYVRLSQLAGDSPRVQLSRLHQWAGRALWGLAFIPGSLLATLDSLLKRIRHG